VALEAGDPRVLIDLARRGLGVAILPASAPDDLHAIAIRPRLRSRLELVWRGGAETSPAARELAVRTRRSLADRRADRATAGAPSAE
jgi:DNA-binding transcriptional LysR family regulator